MCFSKYLIIDHYLGLEVLGTPLIGRIFFGDKSNSFVILLSPFDHERLITDDLVLQIAHAQVGIYEYTVNKFGSFAIPSIQVDSSHERLQQVPRNIATEQGTFIGKEIFPQAEVFSYLVKILAPYHTGAHFGQVALILIRSL